jgi:hypothetical protein
MKRRLVFMAMALYALYAQPALASPEFKRYNPDIGKYEFARSYISALRYVHAINARWKKSPPKKKFTGSDLNLMRGYVSYLVRDNADLRIAKNFLTKYLEAPSPLIRKVADMFISSCNTVIAINDKEKEIWDQWYAIKENKKASRANETAFLDAQEQLAFKRKTAYRTMIETSVLLTVVLKSDRNADQKGHVLALTAKQREKLLAHLDEYGRDVMDWGLKLGQDHVRASIAVLREVLEDTIYTTLNE